MAPQGRGTKSKAPPTLLVFLQALEGKRVKVELHNETTVEGRLEEVSDSSDFTLEGGPALEYTSALTTPWQPCLMVAFGDIRSNPSGEGSTRGSSKADEMLISSSALPCA